MACHVDTSTYQLHLYQGYPSDAPDCWSNPNVYLVEPNAQGGFSPLSPKVTNPTMGKAYFFVGRVQNSSTATRILEMRFSTPSFMLVNGENVKIVKAHETIIPNGQLVEVRSAETVQFIHPGNYEIAAELKSWFRPDPNANNPPPTDWPTKGPLYARNSVMVKNT